MQPGTTFYKPGPQKLPGLVTTTTSLVILGLQAATAALLQPDVLHLGRDPGLSHDLSILVRVHCGGARARGDHGQVLGGRGDDGAWG